MDFASISSYIFGLNLLDLIGIGIIAGIAIWGFKHFKTIIEKIV